MPNGEGSFGQDVGKDSSFDKIIAPGFSDEDKQTILGDLSESFENAPEIEGELEKTPTEKKVIEMANWITSQVVLSLGLKPLDVPENNVKVLPVVHAGGKDVGGEMEPRRQIIKLERQGSRLVTFHNSIHEMFHMKAFGAIQTLAGKPSEIDFNARSGLGISSRDGSKRYFWPLNEAVTESLSISAMDDVLKSNPQIFSQEMAETEHAKRDLNAVDDSGVSVPTDDIYFAKFVNGEVQGNSLRYQKERAAFDTLVEKIYQENTETFATKGDVQEQFFLAYFSGKILAVAELVDRTFGKGMFRRIGEAKTAEELTSVVDSL